MTVLDLVIAVLLSALAAGLLIYVLVLIFCTPETIARLRPIRRRRAARAAAEATQKARIAEAMTGLTLEDIDWLRERDWTAPLPVLERRLALLRARQAELEAQLRRKREDERVRRQIARLDAMTPEEREEETLRQRRLRADRERSRYLARITASASGRY